MSLGSDTTNTSPAPQKQKYIPPARRSSPDGSSSDGQASSYTSKGKPDESNKNKGSSRNSSPERPSRSPSPKGIVNTNSNGNKAKTQTPVNGLQTDKTKEDQFEIWQEKRKGGNRAPKIEPEGTKNWRTPAPKVQPKITLLRRDLVPKEGVFPTVNQVGNKSENPLSRWPEYPSELLDVIDMHLNVLIQCISPVQAKLSFRCLPMGFRKSGSFPVASTLPPAIFTQDLDRLAKVILEGLLELPSAALQYLLECEEEVGNRGWSAARELDAPLYGLAVAQINEASTRNVLEAKFDQMPDEQRNLFCSRQYLLAQEQASIVSYILKHNASYPRNSLFTAEIQQLVRDCENGTLMTQQFATWKACLSYHWFGKVQSLPDYPALLRAGGFEPGKRTPAQLVHPKEPRIVFDTVAAWMQRIRLEEQFQTWNYPLPLCQAPSSLNTAEWKEQVKQDSTQEKYAIDFAKSLSLNRNWKNQFMI